MNLQEFAWIGGMVGSVTAVISVIFASIQIRNNTRAIRAAAFQQVAGTLISQLDMLANDANLLNLVLRGSDDFEGLDRFEKARFRFHQQGHVRRAEIAWMQDKLGTLKGEHKLSVGAMLAAVFAARGHRDAWAQIRHTINPEFRAYVDEIVRLEAAKAVAAAT